MALRVERYGNTRHWAVYDGQGLVVVTLYKRGAQEVLRRLAAQPPAATEAAAQAAAQEAAAQQAQALAAQACARARQAQPPRPAASPSGRFWRAITPGRSEGPPPATAPGDTRQPRTARLPWTARAWWPVGRPLPAGAVLGISFPAWFCSRGMRAPGGAGGRPPASNRWLAAQHAAGATRPAVLGVPQAALTGPLLAALTAVPCRVSAANSEP